MFITNPGKKIGKCDLYFFLRNFDQLQFVQNLSILSRLMD